MSSLWTKNNRLILIECDHCPCIPPVCSCLPPSALALTYGTVSSTSTAGNCTWPHNGASAALAKAYMQNRVWVLSWKRQVMSHALTGPFGGFTCSEGGPALSIPVNIYDSPDFEIPGCLANEQSAITGCFAPSGPNTDNTWRWRILATRFCSSLPQFRYCKFICTLYPSGVYSDNGPYPQASTEYAGNHGQPNTSPPWNCGDNFTILSSGPMFFPCTATTTVVHL